MTMEEKTQLEVEQLYLGPYQRDPTGERETSIGDLYFGGNLSFCFFSVAEFGHSSPNPDLVSVQLNRSR